MIQKILRGITAAAMLGAFSCISISAAEGVDVHGDVGMFNQYIWRGAPQNTNKAAVQGDIHAGTSAGPGTLTASVWASNTFASSASQFAGQDAIEFDWTLDYSVSLGDVGLSAGAIYYTYLRDSTANFVEIYGGLSYDALPIKPFVTAYYTVADASTQSNNLNEVGDLWIDAGVSSSLGGFDWSAAVSFALYADDATRAVDEAAGHFEDGISVVTLAASRDFAYKSLTFTPSLTVYIPVVSEASDGNRYIYNTDSDPNVVFGVNMAW